QADGVQSRQTLFVRYCLIFPKKTVPDKFAGRILHVFSSLLQKRGFRRKTAKFPKIPECFSCNIPSLQTEQFVVS
ncbi:hypothetical protein, partial [Ruminococcus callidus]